MQDNAYKLPFRAVNRPGFWRGVLSAFNFFPALKRRSTGNDQVDDALALASDWLAVGNDLEKALDQAHILYGHSLEARDENEETPAEPGTEINAR